MFVPARLDITQSGLQNRLSYFSQSRKIEKGLEKAQCRLLIKKYSSEEWITNSEFTTAIPELVSYVVDMNGRSQYRHKSQACYSDKQYEETFSPVTIMDHQQSI